MKSRFRYLAVVAVFGGWIAAPAALYGLPQGSAAQHDEHHSGARSQPAQKSGAKMTADMTASDARIDALVKKMNAATGSKKTDAIAELLTALVQEHRAMRGSMMTRSSMVEMMKMKNQTGGAGDADSPRLHR